MHSLSAAGGLEHSVNGIIEAVATSLSSVSDNLNAAVEAFSGSIEEGGVTLLSPITQMETLAETDGALDVNVMNPTDIYDPAEIERLRGEGFNNREIGQILRDTALPAAEPLADMMTFPAPDAEPIQTLDGAVGGGTVNVRVTNIGELSSALGGTRGADGSGSTQINPTFVLQLDDGSLMTKVEGRIAVRADQGLSPLKV